MRNIKCDTANGHKICNGAGAVLFARYSLLSGRNKRKSKILETSGQKKEAKKTRSKI